MEQPLLLKASIPPALKLCFSELFEIFVLVIAYTVLKAIGKVTLISTDELFDTCPHCNYLPQLIQ